MKQDQLKVEGMSCGHCVKTVEEGLKKIGVQARVDLASKTVTVDFDESKTDLNAIKAAIDDMGYDVV